MIRVVLAILVLLTFGFVGAAFDEQLGAWGVFLVGLAGMFAVSAVLPHYFYRGEPLLPDRRRRR